MTARDKDGNTPKDLAIQYDFYDCAEVLTELASKFINGTSLSLSLSVSLSLCLSVCLSVCLSLSLSLSLFLFLSLSLLWTQLLTINVQTSQDGLWGLGQIWALVKINFADSKFNLPSKLWPRPGRMPPPVPPLPLLFLPSPSCSSSPFW